MSGREKRNHLLIGYNKQLRVHLILSQAARPKLPKEKNRKNKPNIYVHFFCWKRGNPINSTSFV